MAPRAKLRRLWVTMRVFLLGVGAVFIITPRVYARLVATGAFVDPHFGVDLANYATYAVALQSFLPAGVVWVVCALIATPTNRGRVLRSLGRLGQANDELAAAAAVAALVGHHTAGRVLELAATRFRTLPIDACSEADWLTNDDTGLHGKTEPAALGSCAAFVSHSWHDDGKAKYRELVVWGAAFRAAHDGRPVTIWLDKACIDQGDIEANLACLPVFLSGCRELLVLAGTTYHTRLWCVMELFTFVQMGGVRERITIIELDGDARAALAKFDAARARCFLPKDREHLIAVMETGFGDLRPFNRVVRSLLQARVHAAASNSQRMRP